MNFYINVLYIFINNAKQNIKFCYNVTSGEKNET